MFGNDRVGSTPSVDARFFDAPLDAPPACPSTGSPTFRAGLLQVNAPDNCSNFSVAENGTIMAVCPGTTSMVLYGGTVADGLRPAITDLPGTDQPLEIRIAPEGDFAIVQLYIPSTANQRHALRIDPATSIWHDLGAIPVPTGFLSTPTRAAPDRHMLLYDLSGDQFFDFVGDGIAWTKQPAYTTSPTSGFHSINNPFALTPDGLRIVANASPFANGLPELLYGVRPDLSTPFTESSLLDEASSIQQPALSEDCGELFFIAIDRILYVKQ